jgi:hypothetical protein
METYGFNVGCAQEIDLFRIVRENADAVAIFVRSKEADTTLLMLSERFLSRFDTGDDVRIYGWLVDPSWGETELWAMFRNRGVRWIMDPEGNKQDLLHVAIPAGYRARVIYTRSSLNSVKEDIRAAMKYRRKVSVQVETMKMGD